MLVAADLQPKFWKEAITTTVSTFNRTQLRPNNEKAAYELWKGRPTLVKYVKIFGRKFFTKINDDLAGKFNSRIDEEIFLGYSTRSKAYKCYNNRLWKIVKSMDVNIDEEILKNKAEDHEVEPFMEETEEEPEKDQEKKKQKESSQTPLKLKFIQKNHLEEKIINNVDEGIQTQRRMTSTLKRNDVAHLSMVKPKTFSKATKDPHWVKAMEEEMSQIKKNKTWELVHRPKDKNKIVAKWVFKNKMNEDGKSLEIRQDLFVNVIHKLKESIFKKPLHQ